MVVFWLMFKLFLFGIEYWVGVDLKLGGIKFIISWCICWKFWGLFVMIWIRLFCIVVILLLNLFLLSLYWIGGFLIFFWFCVGVVFLGVIFMIFVNIWLFILLNLGCWMWVLCNFLLIVMLIFCFFIVVMYFNVSVKCFCLLDIIIGFLIWSCEFMKENLVVGFFLINVYVNWLILVWFLFLNVEFFLMMILVKYWLIFLCLVLIIV